MANTNCFGISLPKAAIQAFRDTVVAAGAENEFFFDVVPDADVKGRTEVWRLKTRRGHGSSRRKVSISGYESGAVNFQGIDPIEDLHLDVKVTNTW